MVRVYCIFTEAFDTETTMLLILTNMFSLWATVLAAPHGCLKYSAKWKRQVNEGVGGFISMVFMSTTPLMCNKQNSVRQPRDFTTARVLMLCVTPLSVFMHNAAWRWGCFLFEWLQEWCNIERLFPVRAWLELIPATSAWYKAWPCQPTVLSKNWMVCGCMCVWFWVRKWGPEQLKGSNNNKKNPGDVDVMGF